MTMGVCVVPWTIVDMLPAKTWDLLSNGELSSGERFNFAWGSDGALYLSLPDGLLRVATEDLVPALIRSVGTEAGVFWTSFERDPDRDMAHWRGYVNSLYEAWVSTDCGQLIRFRRVDGDMVFSAADIERIVSELAEPRWRWDGYVLDFLSNDTFCLVLGDG